MVSGPPLKAAEEVEGLVDMDDASTFMSEYPPWLSPFCVSDPEKSYVVSKSGVGKLTNSLRLACVLGLNGVGVEGAVGLRNG